MIAYKFLAAGRLGTFSGVRWPEPLAWLEAEAGLERSVSGIHALRARALLDWIDDELWTCELGGAIEDVGDVLVAERGRLLERVEAWNEATAYDFARSCATRGRELVVDELRRDGHEQEMRELDGLDATSFVTTAVHVAARLPSEAAGLLVMAADTTALAEGRRLAAREPQLRSHLEAVAGSRSTYGAVAANVAFVVSRSTASLHPAGPETGFAVERAWQLDRLLDQLRLAVAATAYPIDARSPCRRSSGEPRNWTPSSRSSTTRRPGRRRSCSRATRVSASRRCWRLRSSMRGAGACVSSSRVPPSPSRGWATSRSVTCSTEPSTTSCPCCRRRGGTPSRSRCSSRSRTTAPSIRARSRSRPGARSRRWPSGRRCSSRSTTSSGSTPRRRARSRSPCGGSTARARCASCSRRRTATAGVGARACARPGARPTARGRAARRRRAPPVPPRPARPSLRPPDAAAHPRAVGREPVLRPRAGACRRPRRRPDAAAAGSRDARGGRPAAARGASLVDPQRARAPLGARARPRRTCSSGRGSVRPRSNRRFPRRCSSGTRGSSGSRTRCWPPSCTAAWATSGWPSTRGSRGSSTSRSSERAISRSRARPRTPALRARSTQHCRWRPAAARPRSRRSSPSTRSG